MQDAKPPYVQGADLDTLWSAVATSPEDQVAHDRFINFAVLAGRHQEAISRYQRLGETSPAHKELVEKKKVAIAMRVAANLMAAAPRPTFDRGRARSAASIIVLGVLMVMAALIGASPWAKIGWLGLLAIGYGGVEAKRAKG